jgi:RNA polymerase primary sigma factor
MFTWSTTMYGTEARECGVSNYLQTYFRDINESSLLSAADECELAEAIAQGDLEAKQRMIQANLRLVVRIARDYLGRGMVLEDLIGEGNLGLIRAAKDYDPAFGTRFSTYASYWIKQAIRHALINTTSTIRLPAHMFGLLSRWRRTERTLCRDLGRAPSFDEVAASLGLSETQKGLVAKARCASQVKLESCLGDEEALWSPDGSQDVCDAPDATLEFDEERAEVLRRMARLDERERLVLTLRFGLMGQVPLTLKEIGRRLGVTREWVRKIELKAVSRLQRDTESPRSRPQSAGRGNKRRQRATRPVQAIELGSAIQPASSSQAPRSVPPYLSRMPHPAGRTATPIAVAS